jgi:cytochrome c biogenesis protein CcmG/thiol:disulfide interchange protein DsbE
LGEVSPASTTELRAQTRKRNLIIIAAAVPLAALFAILGWALSSTGGTPGGLGVNTSFGEVSIAQEPAEDFVMESLTGGTVSLPALQGKVVVVDFWASWCRPCRVEAATLAQVYREYQGRDVEFVGMAIWDNLAGVKGHIREFDVPYPTVIDGNGKIAIEYGVAGIPEKFFIDSQGMVVRKFIGPIDADSLRDTLDGLLAP